MIGRAICPYVVVISINQQVRRRVGPIIWVISQRVVVDVRTGGRGRRVQVSYENLFGDLTTPERAPDRTVLESSLSDSTVCTSAPACSNALGSRLSSVPTGLNSSLTCNSAPTVYSESQMSCNVIQSTLQSLFPLSSVLTITRSLNSSLTPGGTDLRKELGLVQGGNGSAWAQLWYDGVEQFYCAAEGCVQTISAGQGNLNASTWTCPTLTCHCRSGATFCGGGTTVSSIIAMK